jgi:asparagine synthetase B (glutamine-hydrolysing)
MSAIKSNSMFGDFTTFGFTSSPGLLKDRFPIRLGITPRIIQIGSLGQIFFYSSSGEIAETEETVVIKLGFLRSTAKSTLNAHQLLEQKLVGPRSININGFSGNGLVVGLSKTEPVISVFQTLMAIPQLYYFVSKDGIICSDVLRCLVRLMPHCELNEAILPQHFLFRSVHGSSTYFQGVERLIPGQSLKWADGNSEIRHMRSLVNVYGEAQYISDDTRALNLLCESLQNVVGDYTQQVEKNGQKAATLLSGGVDSSLVQYFINTASSQRPWRSISFSIQVPAFQFETEYARQASQLLQTEHTYVKYTPEDYPGLLTRAVETLAQPTRLETEPSLLAVVEYIQEASWPERYFFTALAADSVFGLSDDAKLKGLHIIRKIPFAIPLLRGIGRTLSPLTAYHSHMLLRGADILASENDPDAYISPLNSVCVYVLDENWDIIRRCFGDELLRQALAYRRDLAAQYSTSRNYLDQVHFVDLFVGTLEQGAQRRQLFLAHHLDQIDPFCDEDILNLAFTIHPDMRYMKGFRYKHLLKRLLTQKTGSPVAHMRKGGSTVNNDLEAWMRSGPLRPLVEEIQRPSFLSKQDFETIKQRSDYFLWPLLTFDVFCKRVIKNQQ